MYRMNKRQRKKYAKRSHEKLAKTLNSFRGQWVNMVAVYDTDKDGNQYVKQSYFKTTSYAE